MKWVRMRHPKTGGVHNFPAKTQKAREEKGWVVADDTADTAAADTDGSPAATSTGAAGSSTAAVKPAKEGKPNG